MKERIIGFIKKIWLPLWCVIVMMSICSMFVSALYDSSISEMKRVVRSTSSQGTMFSSNILVENGDSNYTPKYFSTLNNNNGTYDVDVYLWNYSLKNLSRWYSSDIDYKINLKLVNTKGEDITEAEMGERTIQLVKVSGNTQTKLVVLGKPDSQSFTSTYTSEKQTLVYSSNSSAEDRYILKYSGNWDLKNDTEICVRVKAEPFKNDDASKYKDISPLSMIIGLKESNFGSSNGWQAYLAEANDNKVVGDCDGYNLVVTGSGKATVTIKWDTSKLVCNKNFCEGTVYSFGSGEVTYTAPPSGSSIATMVINADTGSSTTNYRNRYDIQFYKNGAEPSDWTFFKNDGTEVVQNVWLSVNVQE